MKHHNTDIYAYADDTAILVYGPTWDVVKTIAEEALSKVMKWLNYNLLTLNLAKTTYIPFAIRRNTRPAHNFSIAAHSCSNPVPSCDCPTLTRSDSIKYLGVQIDDGLRWDKQIDALTNRTMRLIHVFKSLRESANRDTLRMVYCALCQSVLGYCITAWGGAAKTKMLTVERAQRAILKVMTRKPYRFPTKELYSNCNVLTVRQLFILRSILRTHAKLPPPNPKKRLQLIRGPQHKTAFATHQFYTLSIHLYNKINKELKIQKSNTFSIKNEVTQWLLERDYTYTESLLTYIT